MKYLLSVLLLISTALAASVSQNFRLRILVTEGALNGTAPVEYLGVKNGVAVITNDSKSDITAYLDPAPRGMLNTTNKIPGYLLPTTDPSIYDFRFGSIPKIAGVLYTEFTFIDTICVACIPDKILAYSPPKDNSGARYEGEFRAYKVGEDWVVKFHTSRPKSIVGSVGVDLIRKAA
ncbi:hypothetical protein L873DRAFT_1804933 [Choiromyces venosus 120613-1]|uniref:Uncharacterized protein n=1 Tax=Choiromyces venosus 120613-1 TaxID=1336337 RepID=A0A3N4JQC1_9PEZI|nr:hypothetical protein L873DRAFT_1804933 [Choiromyces venosus 120613-1]